jgi:uncharacterized membrane protein YccC
MAASIVHFGEDFCFRRSVLRSAGYVVVECDFMEGLSSALTWNPDAVVLEEEPRPLIYEALSLTRSRSTASLILFRKDIDSVIPDQFDLVIPSLTEPQQWLSDIAALIARSRSIRAQLQTLTQKSASLRQDSAAVRKSVRKEREGSIPERSKYFGNF